KAIPKSHPLFQEFRLWQFLRNLKVYQKNAFVNGKQEIDHDVTSDFLKTEDDWVDLFDYLNARKEVESKNVIQFFIARKAILKTEKDNYRWNYVEDKKYPCNATKSQFIARLNKVNKIVDYDEFLREVIPTGSSAKCPKLSREIQLWHIIYSVKDKTQFEKALGSFAIKNKIDKLSFIENFKKFPPFKNEYGAYSEKAIKKLLPLMRRGKYWNESDISDEVKNRIFSILERVDSISNKSDLKNKYESVADDDIPKQLVKSFESFIGKNPLQGLNTYQAGYAVYNRHSEAKDISKWNTPNDINHFLKEFKQHSLRNPIVEQVVTETLRVVRDIWEYFGGGEKDYFNEIHIELGREMKNPANIRKSISEKNTENENTNIRIKELLKELKNDSKTEGEVRPYSPSQQEILKIYEEGVFQSLDKIDDEIIKIRKTTSPSNKEIEKYKLWLEQGYISPYTGIIIPLGRLFTTDYQIEHIIPQSRYFDNSLSNKIICESVINEEKSNATAYEFLKNRGGEIFPLGQGKQAKLLQLQDYEAHCNKYFKKNRAKLKKLLSEEVPEGFIERQLNDSRYISKLIKGLLSNIVREEGEQEATSKNIVTVTGAITSKLKQDWGLNDKWNEIVAPRFKRLNEITQSNDFGFWDSKVNAFRTRVPDELARGFNKKRIDHRHHALDALIIAAVTKDHINYITSINTQRKNHALVSKLRKVKVIEKVDKKTGEIKKIQIAKAFHQPWSNFTTDAKVGLERIVVSFKQNLRVINKTNNKYWSYKDENGKLRLDKEGHPKKGLTKQIKGDNWAIRKPLHAPLPYGEKEYSFSVLEISKDVGRISFIADKNIRAKLNNIVVKYKTIGEAQKYLKKNPV
ncbi:MAG: CRISPR-associated protein Csn1, partial [Bacteroidetes bacterium]